MTRRGLTPHTMWVVGDMICMLPQDEILVVHRQLAMSELVPLQQHLPCRQSAGPDAAVQVGCGDREQQRSNSPAVRLETGNLPLKLLNGPLCRRILIVTWSSIGQRHLFVHARGGARYQV